VAGKTGTTDESKSAWFVGYTPQMSAAVMMTKADKKGRPISLDGVGGLGSVSGGSFPAAIWATFADAALSGEPELSFAAPGGDVVQIPPPDAGQPRPDPSDSASASPEESGPNPSGDASPSGTQSPSEAQSPSAPDSGSPVPTPPEPGPEAPSLSAAVSPEARRQSPTAAP
jgi:membrane peptidoglycan carboxypeptidase